MPQYSLHRGSYFALFDADDANNAIRFPGNGRGTAVASYASSHLSTLGAKAVTIHRIITADSGGGNEINEWALVATDGVTDTTISFDTTDDSINDTNAGLGGFVVGKKILVLSTSGLNDGEYTVATVTASKVTVSENLTTETAVAAGTVTVTTVHLSGNIVGTAGGTKGSNLGFGQGGILIRDGFGMFVNDTTETTFTPLVIYDVAATQVQAVVT